MTEPQQQPERRRINLEIPADLQAVYTNFAIITHSPWEVFIDLAQILPNVPKARMQTRLVLTPTNAKMLLRALEENIKRYEQQYGEIKVPQRLSLADQLFSSIGPDGESHTPDGEENNEQPE